jgi:cell division protease FtsH
MVTQLGMSEKLGPLTWGRHQQLQYLGQSVEDRNYSEETARSIDSEVRALVESGHQQARGILAEHRALLDRLAGILEKQEVLAGEELGSILSELRQPGQAQRPIASQSGARA